jgi:hypothetical protein
MLRKFHYADWDAKYTAILNSSVVCGFLFIAVVDMILLIVSPERLQYLYDYPRTRYVLSDFIILFLLFIRYYYLRKDAIPLMKAVFKSKGWDKGWLLFVANAVILVGSIVIGFFVAQYVKSQGIVFG